MAEIRYDINVEGAEEGARGIDGVKVAMADLGAASTTTAAKVNKAGDEIEDAGDKSSTATDAIAALKGGFAAAATVIVGAGAALATATAGFVAFAAEAERRAGIMRAFAGDLSEVHARTGGLVSSLEAMSTANRLARAGIQLTSRDLANVMVGAIEVAQERGEDLGSTLDQLTSALEGASADELRNFGISVQEGANRTDALTGALDDLEGKYGNTTAKAAGFGGALEAVKNLADDFLIVFQEVVEQTGVLGEEWDALMEDFGLGDLTIDQLRGTLERAAVALGAAFVESVRFARREITDFLQTINTVVTRLGSGDFRNAMLAISNFADRSEERRGELGGAIGERAAAIGSSLAARRDAARRRSGRRTIRPGGGGDSDQPTLDELMDGASGGFGSLVDDISGEATEGIEALDEARKESEQLAHDMHEREKERIAELTERRKAAAEEEYELAREQMQKTADDAMGVLGPAMTGLTDVLSNVIAGTESADHAFQGLLASFLEMISQKAALEAAGQFAAAVASFASQDYGGGALHLAAGVAWTAVAVAAGAASVAVAPPAASAQPANPQQNATPGGGGGDTIVNLNGAVVTAGTRAELGRELGTLIEAGGRRFGRAA